MAFAFILVPAAGPAGAIGMTAGHIIKNQEASMMNKWIPISVFVFLGIYLLTTAQASVFGYPDTRTTKSSPYHPVDPIQLATQ